MPRLRQRIKDEGILLERELEAYQDQAEEYPVFHRHLAALRFYLQEILWNCGREWLQKAYRVSNYAALASEIDKWRESTQDRVAYVTFNYDTLLEAGLSDAIQLTFSNIESYISDDSTKVFKLHGSVDWGREVVSPPFSADTIGYAAVPKALIKHAANVNVSHNYVRVGSERIYVAAGSTPVFPAIAIPVETKTNFECPTTTFATTQRTPN